MNNQGYEYKKLWVNEEGKVTRIDGVPQVSIPKIIIDFIIGFFSDTAISSGPSYQNIRDVLSKFGDEGWEHDATETRGGSIIYILKRSITKQQLVSESMDVEKINPIWAKTKPFVFAFIGGMVFLVLEVICSIGSTRTYKQFLYDPNNPGYPIWISGYIVQPFFSALLGGYLNNKKGWSALPSIILGFVSGIVYFILYIFFLIRMGY